MAGSDRAGLAFGTTWIVLCLAGTLWLLSAAGAERVRAARPAPAVVGAIALLLRLLPALVLNRGAGYDIASYHLVGTLVLAGHNPYAAGVAPDHYPYLPAQLYLSAVATRLAMLTRLPFVVLAKFPAVVADGALAAVLCWGLRRYGHAPGPSSRAGLLYATNPVSILVTSYHGQFDALPLLAVGVAWALLAPPRPRRRFAALALGLAILIKTWPVLLLPAFAAGHRRNRERALLLAWVLALPLAATVAYCAAARVPPGAILGAVTSYSGVPGWWGLSLPLGLLGAAGCLTAVAVVDLARDTTLVCLGVLTLTALHLAREPVRETAGAGLDRVSGGAVRILFVFYTLCGTVSLQYMIWIVPLALAAGCADEAWLNRYLLAATGALSGAYLLDGWVYRVSLVPQWHGYSPTTVAFLVVAWATLATALVSPSRSSHEWAFRGPDAHNGG